MYQILCERDCWSWWPSGAILSTPIVSRQLLPWIGSESEKPCTSGKKCRELVADRMVSIVYRRQQLERRSRPLESGESGVHGRKIRPSARGLCPVDRYRKLKSRTIL